MGYWDFDGKNGLEGVEPTVEVLTDCPPAPRLLTHPDPDNPAVLPREDIFHALRTSRAARTAFQGDFAALSPEAQERLTDMLELNPRPSALVEDDQAFADRIQAQAIRSIPVRTVGRRGGKGGRGA